MPWVIKKARHLSMSSLLHAQVCFSAQHYVCIVLARVFTIVECRSGVHTTHRLSLRKKALPFALNNRHQHPSWLASGISPVRSCRIIFMARCVQRLYSHCKSMSRFSRNNCSVSVRAARERNRLCRSPTTRPNPRSVPSFVGAIIRLHNSKYFANWA